MELLLLAYGVNLVVCFLISMAGGALFDKDWLKVLIWGAVLGPLACLIALILLKPEEGAVDDSEPKRKKLSKSKQKKLDEVAEKMGMR